MGLSTAYGINANSLGEPYSLLVSILLILGLVQLGLLLERFVAPSPYSGTNTQPLSLRKIAIAPIYGACVIGAPLFPILLFGSHARQLLFSIAMLLCLFGIYFSQSQIRLRLFSKPKHHTCRIKYKAISTSYILCLLFLFGYALLSSSPPTDADDLDYHSGVALALLNQGSWPFAPEWFHSRLAGVGESLLAIGYSIGAKQFGSLLQFCGLACISSLLMRPSGNKLSKLNGLMALVFLSSPVLLWLSSTSKPLLLPIAMTTLALWHSIQALRTQSPSRRELLIHFCSAITLISLASQMKFNFLLSGFLVGMIAIYVMHLFKLLRLAIPRAAIISGIIMIPFSTWKQAHYGGNWVSNLYTLFPGNWPGYALFEIYLRHYEESSFSFPFSLIISTPNQATNLIGLGVIAWFIGLIWLISKWPTLSTDIKILYFASVALAIMGSVLGQHGGRFYLEPLAWMLLAVVGMKKIPLPLSSQFAVTAIYLQSTITALGLIICIWILFPATLNEATYHSMMLKRAYQYPEMQALETFLPNEAVLLTDSRSIALSPRQTLSAFDWPNYIAQSDQDPHPYLHRIKHMGVSHFQTRHAITSSPWQDCIDHTPILTTNSQHNSRNPLNAGAPYQVWVYAFDSTKLPGCFKPPK